MARHANSNRPASRRTAQGAAGRAVEARTQRSVSADNRAQSAAPTKRSVRYAARARDNQVDVIMPLSEGDDAERYRRRSRQRNYVENVQRRARRKRAGVALAVVAAVVALALVAGFLAFRGVIGSHLSLQDSDARDALSSAKSGEAAYTLVAVELGAVAEPLEQEGPDMLVLVRSDRETPRLALIGIPASLKVTVDNDTRRLADLAANGDASLISACESYTKVDINHYVKVEEGQIASIVDALGGIDMTFDQVVDDPRAGDVYYPLGDYTVNGQGALTYLRAANFRMGKSDQALNQVEFLKLIIDKVIGSERGFTSEIEAIDEFFQTDLSLSELEDFAKWAAGLTPDAVECAVVPGYFSASSDVVGDNAELYVSKTADFETLIDAHVQEGATGEAESSTPSASVAPSSFTVEVVNGTDIVGAARTTAEALDAQGFRIADVGNAEQQVYDETLVIYRTSNTPAKVVEPQVDEYGNALDEYGNPVAEESAGNWDDGSATESPEPDSPRVSAEEADAAERALGQARADAVIQALGIGRAVEGDMYYSFNADVLLIIGYDYKPVS